MRQLALPYGFYRAARLRAGHELPAVALERSRQLDLWHTLRTKGCSSTEAAAPLAPSRATLYRWARRAGPTGDATRLVPRSRRPHRRRQRQWDPALLAALRSLREQQPRWGKAKLGVLLRTDGRTVSDATVGRMLAHLKATGALREPPRRPVSAGKRRLRRPHATRKPKDYRPTQPGDLVEVDTLDLRPLPGVVLKQFTARDVVARWDVLDVRTQATATTAAHFLERLLAQCPFEVRTIQVDGGSEFMAAFEAACQRHGIRLFVLPPHSPKLNGHVERANRTHTEEFWECYDGDLDLPAVREALWAHQHRYNTLRPHQALAYLTPLEYLRRHHPNPRLSHMY